MLTGRLRLCIDPISSLVTLHLFTEAWVNWGLDQLLQEQPPTNLTFADKLELLFKSNHLSEGLFKNLKSLNWLRNKAAHNLSIDFTTLCLSFQEFNGVIIDSIRPSFAPDSPDYFFRLIEKVVQVTYLPLVDEMTKHGVVGRIQS
jgi:hypothetical protein